MPEFQTIFDGSGMSDFWLYIKYFLFFVAPVTMIWFAIWLVGEVAKVVRRSVKSGEQHRRHDDDDDDDIYYYR